MVDVIHEFRRVRTTLRKTFGVILETKHVNRRLSRYVLTSCRSCNEGIRTSGWGLFSYEIKRTQRQECTRDKTSDIYFIYLDNKDVYCILGYSAQSRFYLPQNSIDFIILSL